MCNIDFAHSVRRRLLLDLTDGDIDPHDPQDELALRGGALASVKSGRSKSKNPPYKSVCGDITAFNLRRNVFFFSSVSGSVGWGETRDARDRAVAMSAVTSGGRCCSEEQQLLG